MHKPYFLELWVFSVLYRGNCGYLWVVAGSNVHHPKNSNYMHSHASDVQRSCEHELCQQFCLQCWSTYLAFSCIQHNLKHRLNKITTRNREWDKTSKITMDLSVCITQNQQIRLAWFRLWLSPGKWSGPGFLPSVSILLICKSTTATWWRAQLIERQVLHYRIPGSSPSSTIVIRFLIWVMKTVLKNALI